jgi:hypothetical protein
MMCHENKLILQKSEAGHKMKQPPLREAVL